MAERGAEHKGLRFRVKERALWVRSDPEHAMAGSMPIAKEGKYISGALAQLLLEAGPDGTLDPLQELSERELMVLRRFAAGERTTEIATSLNIAPSTVSSHLKSLKRKLNVASNAELVRFAVKQGLISE